jgi:hypothetical protein
MAEDEIERTAITEFNPLGVRFWDLPVVTEHGLCIRLISTFAGKDRIGLCIEIDDDTRIDDIRRDWYVIAEWRRRLREFQGPSPLGDHSFYESLLWLKKNRDMLWSELAEYVNLAIADKLAEVALAEAALAEKASDHRKDLRLRIKRKTALHHADDLLRLSRPSLKTRKEREDYLLPALQNIREGREAFPPGFEPVTRDDVRARLREWKKISGEGW